MADAELDLKALCDRAGVTPRTIHFYIQQGLIPPAGTPGPGARYAQGHVLRLRLIRLLQKQHLPLAEIAKRLKGLTDADVRTLVADATQRRAVEHGSALDYIRDVLDEGSSAKARIWKSPAHGPRGSKKPYAVLSFEPSPPTVPARSQWERFTLADGFELQVRRPLSRIQQRQLDKLLPAARHILEPEEEEQI